MSFSKSDRYLILVFVLLGSSILIKSSLAPGGYISPDSENYLWLAQNLLEGKGFYLKHGHYRPDVVMLFSSWPVGYPILIFLVSFLTQLPVFWASKVLNVILIALALLIFRNISKENAYVYGAVFAFFTINEIYNYTWSEAPFSFMLLGFGYSIYNYLKTSKTFWLFSILFFSMALYFIRYSGVFNLGALGLLLIVLLLKKKREFWGVLGITLLSGALLSSYLYFNYLETGFPTGMPRADSDKTTAGFFVMMAEVLLNELNLLAHGIEATRFIPTLLVEGLLGFLFFKTTQFSKDFHHDQRSLWKYFIAVGLIYFAAIVSLRFVRFFDLDYRFMTPLILVGLVGIVSYFEFNYKKMVFQNFKKYFLILAAISYGVNLLKKEVIYGFFLFLDETSWGENFFLRELVQQWWEN